MKIKKTTTIRICAIDEIPVDRARGFIIENNEFPLQLFIIRKKQHIYAYQNRCPHMGTNLDWQADQFLDSTKSLIQCSTHGALFRIEDGFCVHGPCINQSLTVIKTEICGNDVVIRVPKT